MALNLREFRRLGGHDDVGTERDLQAGSLTQALDVGDGRNGQFLEAGKYGEGQTEHDAGLGGGFFVEAAYVDAGREVLPLRTQEQGPDTARRRRR